MKILNVSYSYNRILWGKIKSTSLLVDMLTWWISKTSRWMKEASHKIVYTVCTFCTYVPTVIWV